MIKFKKIKVINEEIVKRLDSLDSICFPSDDLYPKHNENIVWWIVTDNEKDIAFAGVKFFEGYGYSFLCRVGVIKSYRRLGIHKKLLQLREKESKSRIWCKKIITYTAPWNIKSCNNLIRNGYLLYLPHHPFGSRDSLYFYKLI